MSLCPSARVDVCKKEYKLAIDVDEACWKREDQMVEIWKSKREESILKKRREGMQLQQQLALTAQSTTLGNKEDEKFEYADAIRIESLVKNYSQFISFPIYTWQEKSCEKEIYPTLFYSKLVPVQNQPALEKDHYMIRQTFVVAPEESLVVADYGQMSLLPQLELRLLAHLSDCKSMQAAFKVGGDFHSRTTLTCIFMFMKLLKRREYC